MRRFLIGLLAFLGSIAIAAAGDYADRDIIGFSPDGATFAFEEFGVEDGSGFPYSNIFIIDTATDSWLPGTPFRLRYEDESRSLADLRKEARDKALPLIEQRKIGVRGTIVASNPATETSADPHRVTFRPRLILPPSDDSGRGLELAEIALPAADCPVLAELYPAAQSYKGFQLALTEATGARNLHEDTEIPKSRRCPIGYAISDVITHYPEGADPIIAVIVHVYALGFEGPNRRFLAVTTRFKE
jgi:predicted secreted protein